MAVKSIQLGQVWRNDSDGQDYLVTKVYNEVFSQYAVLRPAGITAPDAPTVRADSGTEKKRRMPAIRGSRLMRGRRRRRRVES